MDYKADHQAMIPEFIKEFVPDDKQKLAHAYLQLIVAKAERATMADFPR